MLDVPATVSDSYPDAAVSASTVDDANAAFEDSIEDVVEAIVLEAGGLGQLVPPALAPAGTLSVPTTQGVETATLPDGSIKHADPEGERTDPVELVTGEYVIEHVDLELPSFGVPFRLTRTYRSRVDYQGPFGPGWDHGYNQRLANAPVATIADGVVPAKYPNLPDAHLFEPEVKATSEPCKPAILLTAGNGATIQFRETSRTGTTIRYHSAATHLELVGTYSGVDEEPPTGWTLRSRYGDNRTFDANGLLVSWEDANGIGIALEWHGSGDNARLDSAVDSVGRTIAFEYDIAGRLRRVHEQVSGLEAEYSYDQHGALWSARRADGRAETYEYDFDPGRTRGDWIPEEQLRSACRFACAVSDSTCDGGGACNQVVSDAMSDCIAGLPECKSSCVGSCTSPCRNQCSYLCDSYCESERSGEFLEYCADLYVESGAADVCQSCGDVCDAFADEPCSFFVSIYDWIPIIEANCDQNVEECCTDGTDCDPDSCNVGESCVETCAGTFLGIEVSAAGLDARFSACRAPGCTSNPSCGDLTAAQWASRYGCVGQLDYECVFDCPWQCVDAACGPACDDACDDACSVASCNAQDFEGQCESACTTSCIETGREEAGGRRFGHAADLNFNLVRVFDGGGQLVLSNTYGSDPVQATFDAVVSQEFGAYEASLHRRDFVAEKEDGYALIPTWMPIISMDRDEATFNGVEICPASCSSSQQIPGTVYVPWNDQVLVFDPIDIPGEPVTIPIGGYGDPVPFGATVLPTTITFAANQAGDVVGSLARRTSATNHLRTTATTIRLSMLDPAVAATLRTSRTSNTVTISGSAAAKAHLLDVEAVTLFTDSTGILRVYPGLPRFVSISQGGCTQPFQLTSLSDTEVRMEPPTACSSSDLWITPMSSRYPNAQESDDFLGRGLAALSTTAFDPTALAPVRDGVVWRMGIDGRRVRESAPGGAGRHYAAHSAVTAYSTIPMLSAPDASSTADPLFVFHQVEPDYTVPLPNTGPPPAPSDRPWISLDPVISIEITCDPTLPGSPRRGPGHGPRPARATHVRDFHGARWTYFADDSNNVIRTVNHDAASTWSFNYDSAGHVTGIEYPDGARTCLSHDSRGNVSSRVRLPSTVPNLPTPQPIVEHYSYRQVDSRLLTVTDPRTGTIARTFEWDAAGNPRFVTEADGSRTTFHLVGGSGPARARVGRLVTSSSSETHFAYDIASGTLNDVIGDATGSLPVHDEYVHDEAGRLVSHIGSLGLTRTFSYDGPFLAAQGWNGDGHAGGTTYEVNGDGRVSTQITGSQRMAFAYDPIGTYAHVTRSADDSSVAPSTTCFDIGPNDRLREVVSAEGIRTRYEYDAMGNVVRVEQGALGGSPRPWDDACPPSPSGGAQSFTLASATYDTNGRLRSQTDARGLTTAITYDGHGRPVIVQRPDGSQVRRGFDALGGVVWEAVYAAGLAPANYRAPSWSDAGLRAAVELVYDSRARVSETRRWHFDASNVAVGDGYSIDRFAYDEMNRAVTRTDDANQTWITRYDGAGRVTSEVAPDGTTRTFQYLPDGRTMRVGEPGLDMTLTREVVLTAWGAVATEGAVRAGTTHVLTTTQFDDLLRPIGVTSATGAVTTVTYDAFGRVRDETSKVPGGNDETVSYSYDGDDRILTRGSIAGGALTGIWHWNHDALGRVTAWADPGGGISTTSYIAGSMFPYQTTYPRGVVTTHAWSPSGHPAIINADALDADVYLSFSWDALGRMTAAARTDQGQPAISNTFAWDSLGGKVRETDTVVGSTYARTAVFDGRGLPTQTAVGTTMLARKFDALGRLEQIGVASESAPLAKYSYAGFSVLRTRRIANTTTANTIETQMRYDDLGRRIGQADVRLPSTDLAVWDWEVPLDGVPRRALATRAGVPSHNSIFTVDPAARLTAEDSSSPTAAFALASTTSFSQANAAADAVLTAQASRYELDGRSSWISRQVGATTTPFARDARDAVTRVGSQSLTLDARGAVTGDGSTTIDYDALGMVSRVVGPIDSRTYKRDALGRIVSETAQGNVVTRYAFDGLTRILRQRSANNIDITVDGAGLDEHVAVISGSTRYFLFQDPLGSVYLTTELAGSNHNVREWTSYSAYGEPTLRAANGTVLANSAIGAQYGFQGHPHDFATGFVDMRARMYRPTWGRFVSPDPLGLVDGTNRFAFVGSRPLSFSDPFGLAGGAAGVAAQHGFDGRWIDLPALETEPQLSICDEDCKLTEHDAFGLPRRGLSKLSERPMKAMIAPVRNPASMAAAAVARAASKAASGLSKAAVSVEVAAGAGAQAIAQGGVWSLAAQLAYGVACDGCPDLVGPADDAGRGLHRIRGRGYGDIAELDDVPMVIRAWHPLLRSQPKHHIFPQANRFWFEFHGFDIDRYTMQMDEATHTMLHIGGGPGRGGGWWNTEIMNRLIRSERVAGRFLTPDEILNIGMQMRAEFNLAEFDIVPY